MARTFSRIDSGRVEENSTIPFGLALNADASMSGASVAAEVKSSPTSSDHFRQISGFSANFDRNSVKLRPIAPCVIVAVVDDGFKVSRLR